MGLKTPRLGDVSVLPYRTPPVSLICPLPFLCPSLPVPMPIPIPASNPSPLPLSLPYPHLSHPCFQPHPRPCSRPHPCAHPPPLILFPVPTPIPDPIPPQSTTSFRIHPQPCAHPLFTHLFPLFLLPLPLPSTSPSLRCLPELSRKAVGEPKNKSQ